MLSRSLLERLADGGPHARDALANAAGVDRTELPGLLDALTAAGLDFREAAAGSIALTRPIRWIDHAAVVAAIPPPARDRLERVDCLFQHESTNRYLLDAGAPPVGRARIAMAEYQHAGRGRRGRRWIMPPGTGIALSAAWQFPEQSGALMAFSLAAGAATRRAIRDSSGLAVGLKWPNDLYLNGGKLGGILVEIEPLPGGASHVVAGVGVNVDLTEQQLAHVSDLPGGARDLAGALAGAAPERSRLAGALIGRLIELFAGFAATGFAAYRDEWSAADVLVGVPVALHTGANIDLGVVRGIEADGALIVEDGQGRWRRHMAGDVTVRMGS